MAPKTIFQTISKNWTSCVTAVSTMRSIKTMIIYAAYGAVGWSDSLLGVNLEDFHVQLRVPVESMSMAITSSFVGLTIGSIFLSCGCNKLNIHLLFLACLAVTSTCLAIVPHLENLSWFSGILFLNGLASGAINAASISRILILWGHECSSFLQVLDFMYGIGSIIGPISAAPFLVEIPDDNNNVIRSNITIGSNSSSTKIIPTVSKPKHFGHRLTPDDMMTIYPYSMVAGFMLVTFIGCLICYLIEKDDPHHDSRKENIEEEEREKKFQEERRKSRKQKLDLACGSLDGHLKIRRSDSVRSLPSQLHIDLDVDLEPPVTCFPHFSERNLVRSKTHQLVTKTKSDLGVRAADNINPHSSNIKPAKIDEGSADSGLSSVGEIELTDNNLDSNIKEKLPKVSRSVKATIIILTSLLYAFSNGMGMIESSYLTPYVHESNFKLDMKVGAAMESSSWITHIIAGLISIVVVKKIGLRANLILAVSIIVGMNIFLCIATNYVESGAIESAAGASDKQWILWVSVTGMAIGGCSFFSSLVTFMETIFPVSSRVASIYLIPNCLSNIIWPQIVGRLIQSNPQIFVYSMNFCAYTCALLLAMLLLITRIFLNK